MLLLEVVLFRRRICVMQEALCGVVVHALSRCTDCLRYC